MYIHIHIHSKEEQQEKTKKHIDTYIYIYIHVCYDQARASRAQSFTGLSYRITLHNYITRLYHGIIL